MNFHEILPFVYKKPPILDANKPYTKLEISPNTKRPLTVQTTSPAACRTSVYGPEAAIHWLLIFRSATMTEKGCIPAVPRITAYVLGAATSDMNAAYDILPLAFEAAPALFRQ